MKKRTIEDWLIEYGTSHQNETNKTIHWICVPAIFFSIVCLLSMVHLFGPINLATLAMLLATFFYLRLSPKLTIGLIGFYLFCFWGVTLLALLPWPIWQTAVILFVVAWIGQFYGHKIEGKKPSFLKDIQFLLIGPAWLMSFIYQKWNIRY